MSWLILQCDTPTCDHIERVAEVAEILIGKPCPKCGASLLTQEDYDGWMTIHPIIEAAYRVGMLKSPKSYEESDIIFIGYHDGCTTVKLRVGRD